LNLDFHGYLRALRRWRWMIALITVTAAVTAGLASLQQPKVYVTGAVGLVSPKQLIPPGAGVNDANQVPSIDQLVETYVGLINTEPVRQRLIADGIPRTDGQLRSSITAFHQPSTTLINVTVSDQDPAVALATARDVIPAFNSSLTELQTKVGARQSAQLDSLVPWELPASAPTTPVSPNIPRTILLATAAALVLSLALAIGFERLDNTIKQDTDVRIKLGANLLGSIIQHPTGDLDEPGLVEMITARYMNDPLAEQYRALRTNVMYARAAHNLRSLLVTSTRPGEGKTTTACNLAIVLAQAGTRVILVDADFRRPALNQVFQRPRNIGLGNLILGEEPSPLLISPTTVTNLRIVCSGPTPPNPSELLGSVSMGRVMEKLQEEAEMVIIDSPPVGAVTDATVLGSLVDGALVVVERGGTSVAAIHRTLETLEAVEVNILGIVLNKMRAADAVEYYDYYYGKRPPRGARAAAAAAPESSAATPGK
jgi:succinoglycan biosynthesis transport protein ExoP